MHRVCEKCGKDCNMWHAQYCKRGLCKDCVQNYTFLPDGELVTRYEYDKYISEEREKRQRSERLNNNAWLRP